MAPKVYIKTPEDLFLEVSRKRGVHDLVKKIFRQKLHKKVFRASLGKFGKNPSHPKNLPATPMMNTEKVPPLPLPLF